METVLGNLKNDLAKQNEVISELEGYIAEKDVQIRKMKGTIHNRKIFKKDLEDTIAKLEPEEGELLFLGIIINGEEYSWNRKEINYTQLIKEICKDPKENFSVTYKRHDHGSGIILREGQSVGVTEGMIFNVNKT